jgi:uncharacterized DUF497 family protein
VRFSWDPRKGRTNASKHGVQFIEAVSVFADAAADVVDDAVHADRSLIVGQSRAGRLLVVVFTERDNNEVRIISARRPTRSERRRYEEGKT